MVLFLSVVSASFDAYFASLAFCVAKRLKSGEILYAGSFTFVACFIAMTLVDFFAKYSYWIEVVGGVILIFFGTRYVFHAMLGYKNKLKVTNSDVTMLGISVSLDAACISATLTDENVLLCSILMCIFHTLFIYFGSVTSKLLRSIERLSLLSGLFLVFMGIRKLI